MANNEEKSPILKRSWFTELQGEFRKITWPDKKSLVRETVAVIISAVIIGAVISGLDLIIKYGLNIIIG